MRQASDPFSSPASGSPVSGNDRHVRASLKLGFERDGKTTRLMHREHRGPLLVQKPLYPEGPACCHAIIVHPPGGAVGGDELRISARVGDGAHALLSTPGAAKWYRSNACISRQQLNITVGKDSILEWLPQETILFNSADVVFETCIDLHVRARYLGCEILCFGRTASGERFAQGRLRQRLNVHVEGKPVFVEQGSLIGSSASMSGPLGLAGHTVCASLVCVAPVNSEATARIRQACSALTETGGKFGATRMKSVMLVRYLGDSSEVARRVMMAAWQVLRPAALGREATELRIWNT